MINQKASVLNTITNNGGNVTVTDGAINITGLDSIPLTGLVSGGIDRISAKPEQIQKIRLTFTAANNTAYQFTISGNSKQYGSPVTSIINFISAPSATTATISAQATAEISRLTDFSVSAVDIGSGVVELSGATSVLIGSQLVGPIFSVQESDANIAVSAPLTVVFSAAPTGGRTATGYVVVADSGTLATGIAGAIKLLDGGEGYLSAPTFTFAGGGGGSAAAGTAFLSEGRVVGVNTTGGTAYNSRIGITEVGTARAIRAKYGYLASSLSNPGSPFLVGLASLTDGNTYSEWVFLYNSPVEGGVGVRATTTATIQQSLFVNQGFTTVSTTGSCPDLDTLDSYWGILANTKLGYKVNISDSLAANTASVVASTGQITLAVLGTPPQGAVSSGMKPGDILVVGTGLIVNTIASGIFVAALFTTNTAGFVQFGSSSIVADQSTATVYKLVKRKPIAY